MQSFNESYYFPQALSPYNRELLTKVTQNLSSLQTVLTELEEYELSIKDLKTEVREALREINRLHYQILRHIR